MSFVGGVGLERNKEEVSSFLQQFSTKQNNKYLMVGASPSQLNFAATMEYDNIKKRKSIKDISVIEMDITALRQKTILIDLGDKEWRITNHQIFAKGDSLHLTWNELGNSINLTFTGKSAKGTLIFGGINYTIESLNINGVFHALYTTK